MKSSSLNKSSNNLKKRTTPPKSADMKGALANNLAPPPPPEIVNMTEVAALLETAITVEPTPSEPTLEEIEAQEFQAMVDTYKKRIELLALPVDILKNGLSDIGPSPDQLKSVYHKLSLPYCGLTDINGLSEYPYIFNLELQGNHIKDLSPLASMKYLVQLDVSNNEIEEGLCFQPVPFNIQDVDMSRNRIVNIGDMSSHRFLTRLSLDYNMISDISSLSDCRNLKYLTVCGNMITSTRSLSGLPLKFLDLRKNQLSELSGIESLLKLQTLLVGDNTIDDISCLENHESIGSLDLSNNQIADIASLECLNTLPMLRHLQLAGNPVEDQCQRQWTPETFYGIHSTATYPPSFRLNAIFLIKKLTILDSIPVIPEEKVAATNVYDPPTKVIVSKQHCHQIKQRARAYARIKAEDLMRAKRLRPIVLCGPNGTGKRTLTARLLHEFPQIFGVSVSHTTRKPRPGEEHGVHYWFVTKREMEQLNAEGKFIQLAVLFGNSYGTSMESIDSVTEQGKICLMALEFEGVMALRKSSINARYIVVKTPDIRTLEARLHKRLNGSSDVQQWLDKAMQEEYQGEFDYTLVNDDLERAYKELKEYCLNLYWKEFDEED
ncbi:P-loop containing nucleoside triphosphate hydrolase protein [Globomyces pollinis-pini]|nr:P-loop containing nucleoside triphosphate hydrolase protein [Globomyces pollinis-pini]